MGTTLEPPAIVRAGWRGRRSALRLADRAGLDAVDAAGLGSRDVDLLINAGLYRDRNLGEPALAALIQEDVEANPEDPHPGGHGTFSFDVANGACGVLTSIQIADGFLRARTIEHALVVASDADPGHHLAPRFPFDPAGGAVICRWDDGPRGVLGFRWEQAPGEGELFRSTVGFERGHNALRIVEAPAFLERAAVWAAKASHRVLADHGSSPDGVDAVVANPLSPAFLDALAAHGGFDADALVRAPEAGSVHTAGLLFALAAAHSQGRVVAGHRILLVSAGAGIVAGAALVVC